MTSATRPPTTRKDPAITRQILSVARTTFFLHGFRSVTMDDLAAQMGMSKKTLYIHFRSKQELLDSVIERKFAELEQQLTLIGEGREGDFSGLLGDFVDVVTANVSEITPTFVRDVAKSDPALREKILARRQTVLGEGLGMILAAGRRAGAVRVDLPTDLLVEILLGVMGTIAVPENVVRRGVSPPALITQILDVFLHGVLTPQPTSRNEP